MALPSHHAATLVRGGIPPSSPLIVRGSANPTESGGKQAKADVASRQGLRREESASVACVLHCAAVGWRTGPASLK